MRAESQAPDPRTQAPDAWPAEQLAEARAIIADFVHHRDSLIILACRVLAQHSDDARERREALALAGLLISRTAGASSGAA